MECIPAIDIRAGRCVRLLQGRFDQETDYGDPLVQAKRLVAEGASSLHVVDLDAARSGEPVNQVLVLDIAAAVEVPVQAGGGIRSIERAEQLLGAGVARVVIGTAGVEDPRFTRELCTRHPGRIVLGLDHRRANKDGVEVRLVAVRGWEAQSSLELTEVLGRYEDLELAGFVITDITVDGTLAGPDMAGYELALSKTALPVIASGGIGSASDLKALAALGRDGARLSGAILGRALYSGALSLKEAIAACAA